MRALAVSSLTRVGALPDIPTMDEAGLPGFEAVSWHMFAVPANTPSDVVNRLHSELKAIFALPETREQLVKMGLIAIDTPPVDELQRYLADEIVRWGKLVRDVGIAGTE